MGVWEAFGAVLSAGVQKARELDVETREKCDRYDNLSHKELKDKYLHGNISDKVSVKRQIEKRKISET